MENMLTNIDYMIDYCEYKRPKEWELIPESWLNMCLYVSPCVHSHANYIGGVMYYIAS
jgi:hypothetical protein